MDVKTALADLSEIKKSLLVLMTVGDTKPINGRLWYQKELFLLSKNNEDLALETGFEPYFWGPYSESADAEMQELIQLGLVEQTNRKFVLTKIGKEIADSILRKLPGSEKEIFSDVKQLLNDLTKDELLLFIYASYPAMCEDAVELKELLPKRKEIAVGLYVKGKISLGKASEIAGVSSSELVEELQKRKLYRAE